MAAITPVNRTKSGLRFITGSASAAGGSTTNHVLISASALTANDYLVVTRVNIYDATGATGIINLTDGNAGAVLFSMATAGAVGNDTAQGSLTHPLAVFQCGTNDLCMSIDAAANASILSVTAVVVNSTR